MKTADIALVAGLMGVVLWVLQGTASELDKMAKANEYAYAMGSTVQTTGQGAIIYCNGAPDYIAVKHGRGVGDLVREFVEAACS